MRNFLNKLNEVKANHSTLKVTELREWSQELEDQCADFSFTYSQRTELVVFNELFSPHNPGRQLTPDGYELLSFLSDYELVVVADEDAQEFHQSWIEEKQCNPDLPQTFVEFQELNGRVFAFHALNSSFGPCFEVRRCVEFVNLTPHTINNVEDGEFKTFEPSGEVARVSTEKELVRTINGNSLYFCKPGEVTGLPEQKSHTYLIVSAQVRLALPDRLDLLSPGDLVRDENGRPIGCSGFNCNF